jgi:molybdenum cofactor cytidylyltransferase
MAPPEPAAPAGAGVPGCVGLLLAAGHARRFGGDKLMHRVATAHGARHPLALLSALNLRAAVPEMLAVVREDDLRLQRLFTQHGMAWLAVCNNGMGSSLAAGVRATRGRARLGWVVALADMPFIAPATIAAVAQALAQGAPLAVPTYLDQRGHPVGLAASHGEALVQLSGDVGARHLLQQHAGALQHLAVDDAGILQDIDTPGDAARWSPGRSEIATPSEPP